MDFLINFATGLLNFAWKFTIVMTLIMLVKGIMRNGRGAIRELFDTIGMWIHLKVTRAQESMVSKLRAESEAQRTEEA